MKSRRSVSPLSSTSCLRSASCTELLCDLSISSNALLKPLLQIDPPVADHRKRSLKVTLGTEKASLVTGPQVNMVSTRGAGSSINYAKGSLSSRTTRSRDARAGRTSLGNESDVSQINRSDASEALVRADASSNCRLVQQRRSTAPLISSSSLQQERPSSTRGKGVVRNQSASRATGALSSRTLKIRLNPKRSRSLKVSSSAPPSSKGARPRHTHQRWKNAQFATNLRPRRHSATAFSYAEPSTSEDDDGEELETAGLRTMVKSRHCLSMVRGEKSLVSAHFINHSLLNFVALFVSFVLPFFLHCCLTRRRKLIRSRSHGERVESGDGGRP